MIKLAVTLGLIATGAQASGFCHDIMRLQTDTTLTLPTTPPRQVSCAQGMAQGGKSFSHCAAEFEFRADVATQAFDAISDALLSCEGITRRDFTDQTVNHPDSYDLRLFDGVDRTVSLSLKDKGALQKTFVFLRVESN